MKKKYVFGLLFIVVGLTLFFVPFIIAPVCNPMAEGKVMKCFWTGRAVCGAGALIALLGCAFSIMQHVQKGIAVANILTGIYTIMLVTVLIGTCKVPTMTCNMHTKPTVFLISGIFIIINIIYLFLTRKDH